MSTFHASGSTPERDPQNSGTFQQNNTFHTQDQKPDPNQAPNGFAPNHGYYWQNNAQSPYSPYPWHQTGNPDPYRAPQRPKPSFAGLDTLFAWLSIVVGFLFVRTLPVVQNTLGGILFTCLLFAFGACYLVRSKVTPNAQVIVFAAVTCVLSLGLITGANKTLQRLLFLFILFAFLYWIYSVCGLSGKKIFGDNCFLHALYAIFVVPWSYLDCIFRALPLRRRQENSGKLMRTLGWVLLGLAIAVIPTAIVILLLSYDEQFTALLDKMFSFSLDGVWEYIRDIILGFLVAIVLFGTLFGVKWKRQRNNGDPQSLGNVNCHILPKALLCAAVSPILAVYVIFFVSQWDYYISAFTHVLPGELTYADYARGGFFELCWVCAINAVMLLLFNLLIRRNEKEKGILQAVYSAVISLFTLVLIATALSKMVLYINSYGLTQKRVYASWLMVLLAVIFVLVLLSRFVRKLPLATAIAVCCVAFFGLIVLPDVDGMIASYNVDAYLSGDLDEVDVDSISAYSVSSVPALVELRDELNGRSGLDETARETLQKTTAALEKIAKDLKDEPNGFFTFNIPTARARDLLGVEEKQ